MAKQLKKKTIWIGVIPDIFGYGMSVAAESEAECLKALKKDYAKSSKGTFDEYEDVCDENGKKLTRFEKAMENWGGRIEEVELGKVYWDNFGN
jgi:hypothetical protein